MSLLQLLPYELQLRILYYIRYENQLYLAPLAQTCKSYSNLVGDKINWSGTVTITYQTERQVSSLSYLFHVLKTNKMKFNTQSLTITVIAPYIVPLLLYILEKQQSNAMKNINITLPSVYHHLIYQALSDHPQTQLQHISICDDSAYDISLHHMGLSALSLSQCTLTTLHLPSFPSVLVSQSPYFQFKNVTLLSMALTGHGPEDNHALFWKQLKYMFPNLVELRLHVVSHNQSAVLKALLRQLPLFPWIKRLIVQSKPSPKSYLSRDELRSGLLQLHGLNRITAGWDMIALN